MLQFQVCRRNNFEFEARHFRDLMTESYVTDCSDCGVLLVGCPNRSQCGLGWDTIGAAWGVRDSLWNASCASAQHRKQLLKSLAKRTLQALSIDMSFAPPVIVA